MTVYHVTTEVPFDNIVAMDSDLTEDVEKRLLEKLRLNFTDEEWAGGIFANYAVHSYIDVDYRVYRFVLEVQTSDAPKEITDEDVN